MVLYGHLMVTPTEYPVRVAEVVQTRLAAAEITTRNLSERTGIARMTLARRLTGSSPFTVSELALIAPLIEMSVSDIHVAAESA